MVWYEENGHKKYLLMKTMMFINKQVGGDKEESSLLGILVKD